MVPLGIRLCYKDSVRCPWEQKPESGEMERHRLLEQAASDGLIPVFAGLEKAGLAGKEIAEIAGVTPPTVSKWRCGRARVPSRIVIFLTLVLANRIEEMEAVADGPTGWGVPDESTLAGVRELLGRQERLNRLLPAEAVHEGARMFRHWWHAKGHAFSFGVIEAVPGNVESKVSV